MGVSYYHCFRCEDIYSECQISYGCNICKYDFCEQCSMEQKDKYGFTDGWDKSDDNDWALKNCDICLSELLDNKINKLKRMKEWRIQRLMNEDNIDN